ncbi:hypothetical protein JCM15457_495 [Liquorilactobacillus sucicola DSM 21376 = JCM 15457]|nr:hypothetical protein JCM15457_495 [Liquorilactobacillus sucicola DSM 21376 = JCM 15457]
MKIPGNHLKKRIFPNEIKKTVGRLNSNKSLDTNLVFQEFESVVRGVMLTWCFNNGQIDIIDLGTYLLKKYLNSL